MGAAKGTSVLWVMILKRDPHAPHQYHRQLFLGQYTLFPFLLHFFSKVDEIAPVKSHCLEKRQHVGGIPSDRGINVFDTLFGIKLEYLMGQGFANAQSHEFRLNADIGNPGTFLDAEAAREEISDHESNDFPIIFGYITFIARALGELFDHTSELGLGRALCDRLIDPVNVRGILFSQRSNNEIFHNETPLRDDV